MGPKPHLRAASAAAAAAVVAAAPAAAVPAADGAAAAAAATDQNDDEDDPQAGAVVVSVVEAHVCHLALRHSMRAGPEQGLAAEKNRWDREKFPVPERLRRGFRRSGKIREVPYV